MNFLAHIYLSDDDKQIQIGNFIGDYVKGKNYLNFPNKIKTGILLHREIDFFTDNHLLVKEAKKLFRYDYRLYSGIIVDMFFDHFLAKDWNSHHKLTLDKFCSDFYKNLIKNYKHLPKRVQYFVPFMIQNNRLLSYQTIDGIQSAINFMSQYTSLPNKSDTAIEILIENYQELNMMFNSFLKDIECHVEKLDKNKSLKSA